MNKRYLCAAIVAAACSFCALPVQAQNVAVVNGKAVPQSRVDTLLAQLEIQAARSGRPLPPQLKDQLREEVITREILVQEAERLGLDKSDDFHAKMELARESILAGALFEDFEKKNPISDEDARAQYDKIVAGQQQAANASTEYKASHILVETEDEAKSIIKQVKGGANFEELARKESKDPGSGAQGGDLGWADPANYVPEFADALKALKKGEMTETPVKSQFGWHVIRLDDVRDSKPPEPPQFDAVKDQIKQQLQQQKLAAFQRSLREKARVE